MTVVVWLIGQLDLKPEEGGERPEESASHGHVIERAGKLIPFYIGSCYARSLQQTNAGQNLLQEVS